MEIATTTLPETLADRLRAFRFEEPGATPFADKLAREHRWKGPHAQRVVEEYRRFLWIAATSKEQVSPSDAVDQAWHLHLLDTRSYWERLCPTVLGRALHHEPGRGGLLEHKRLEAAYARTLDAYRGAFGEPPADIWPPPERHRRPERLAVERARGLVLSAPALPVVALVAFVLCGTALLPVLRAAWGSVALSEGAFLFLLAGLGLATVAGGLTLRERAVRPPDARGDDEPLDRYDVAYLAEGPRGAIDVAVTELVCAKALGVSAGPARLVPKRWTPGPTTPLQRLVLEGVRLHPRRGLADQLPKSKNVRALIEPGLLASGLIVGPARRWFARLGPCVVMLALGACGLAKVVLEPGSSSGLPLRVVPFFGVLGAAFALAPLRRTERGDAVLARRRATFQVPSSDSLAGDDFATVVSLHGAAALHSSMLADLAELLAPKPTMDSGSACGGCGG